jgi:hypothetical protein
MDTAIFIHTYGNLNYISFYFLSYSLYVTNMRFAILYETASELHFKALTYSLYLIEFFIPS